MPGVARTLKDVGVDLLRTTVQTTVFVGDQPWVVATEGTVTVLGDVVVASDVTVFVEDAKIAVSGAMMASGASIGKASPDVEAGNSGP
jgi:hypothetical protein